MKPPQHQYCFPNLLEAFFVLVALYFGEMLVNAIIAQPGRSAGLQPMAIYSIGRVLAYGMGFTVLLHHSKATYRELLHENGSSWTATFALFTLPILLLAPGLLLVCNLLQMLVVLLFPMSPTMQAGSEQFMKGGLGTLALVCVIAPIVEEMLFRGIILRSFLRQYPPGVAIVHSAAVFGLAHLNVYQFMVGFVLGCVNGAFYRRTRSLLPCMLLHAFYNVAVVTSAVYLGAREWNAATADWMAPWRLWALASGALGVWMLYRMLWGSVRVGAREEA